MYGIRAASNLMNSAAARVVASGLSSGSDTVTLSPESRALSASGGSDDQLVSGMIDQNIAKFSFAAQVSVLHTADDMTKDLLKIADSTR
jgi:hypothetical protein